MPHSPKRIVVVDPREYDGDPFDAAGRGVQQLCALVQLTLDEMEPARILARNAELDRQIHRGEDPDGVGWDDTAEGRRWKVVSDRLETALKDLKVLYMTAGYNPRNPPK